MKDRLVFVVVLLFVAGLTWFTLTFVDNHDKWEKCSGGPHYFEYEGEYHSEKWGRRTYIHVGIAAFSIYNCMEYRLMRKQRMLWR